MKKMIIVIIALAIILMMSILPWQCEHGVLVTPTGYEFQYVTVNKVIKTDEGFRHQTIAEHFLNIYTHKEVFIPITENWYEHRYYPKEYFLNSSISLKV